MLCVTISKKFLRNNNILHNFIRKSNTESVVRVRFAPSPTGYLHLGGLRTALYNYLFAKSKNGKFILRIEDTDQTRLVKGATEKIIEDLNWSGIHIDEGPNDIGGNYGPYIQSERLEIYRNEVRKLLENGSAYYCFCTERRLELLRKEALRSRQVPKYDNKCRHLTPVQIAEKLTKNDKFCIRFMLTEYREPIKDLIYGDIIYDASDNEGDPIIIKSDGYPTYHLANVIDDHLMNITHVFRGVEWQISTTKHLLLYKAFNWNAPQYGHLPLLINADGTKLSKRQGDIQISQCKERGIYPLALINYVTQAGGGFIRAQGNKPRLYSMEELISTFDIFKVNSNPSKLNPDLLDDFNRLDIKRRLEDSKECDKLVNELKCLVEKTFPENKEQLDLDTENMKNILHWASNRITTLNNLIEGDFRFLWILPKRNIPIDLNYEILQNLCLLLEKTPFQKESIQILLKNFAIEKNLKFSGFMKILRAALSGLKEGPGVAEMMEILGKETSIKRILSLKTK